MAVDLSEAQYIDSLKRAVTPLGATPSTTTTQAQWLGYLTDAFWQCKLDGFMPHYTEVDGEVSGEDGSDLPRQFVALVILYAAINVLTLQVLNTNSRFKAKAGPVEFEQQASSQMLVEMLKSLENTKDRIILTLSPSIGSTNVMVLDALSVRTFEFQSYWGSPELTAG